MVINTKGGGGVNEIPTCAEKTSRATKVTQIRKKQKPKLVRKNITEMIDSSRLISLCGVVANSLERRWFLHVMPSKIGPRFLHVTPLSQRDLRKIERGLYFIKKYKTQRESELSSM